MKENKRIIKRKEQGITLIALVITIIVLLILAGVSIAMLTGENGILTQAQRAKEETEQAEKNEESVLNSYEQYIEGSTNGGTLITVTGNETTNTTVKDSLGNEVIVPAGFKIVNPGDNVEDGIVIEDATHEGTKGSQFVWIPVGENIKKKDGTTFDITLGRYVFNEDGSINYELSKTQPTEQLKTDSNNLHYYIEELKDSSSKNVHSKDIEIFISKVTNNTHGYYIARYEARTTENRLMETEDDRINKINC